MPQRDIASLLFATLLTGLGMIVYAGIALLSLILVMPDFHGMTFEYGIYFTILVGVPILVLGTFSHYLRRPTGSALLSSLIAACIPFGLALLLMLSRTDSSEFWSNGRYVVYEINASGIEFGEELGGGGIQGLVQPQVGGVGEDARWIVIQQLAPNRDPAAATYFYLPKKSDDPKKQDGLSLLQGPFSASDFAKKSADLHLPSITQTFTDR